MALCGYQKEAFPALFVSSSRPTDYLGRMLLTNEDREEFRQVYKKDAGEDITTEEAREIACRLLELYRLLARPLPSEKEARARRPSEDLPSLSEDQQSV